MSDFKQAVKWLKEGKKVIRMKWKFGYEFHLYNDGYRISSKSLKNAEDKDSFEVQCGSFKIEDFEATDWEIYEEKNKIEITAEKLMNWISKSKIQGISPNILIISRPVSNAMRICGKEILVNARPLIHTVMGIEIWVDDSIPKGEGYLFDKNNFIELGDGE